MPSARSRQSTARLVHSSAMAIPRKAEIAMLFTNPVKECDGGSHSHHATLIATAETMYVNIHALRSATPKGRAQTG